MALERANKKKKTTYVRHTSGLSALLNVGDLGHVVLVDKQQEANLRERQLLYEHIVWPHVGPKHVREMLLAVLELLWLRVARLLQADKVQRVLVLGNPCAEGGRRRRVA